MQNEGKFTRNMRMGETLTHGKLLYLEKVKKLTYKVTQNVI